ncbi:MAG: SDR family NAD(P)-dependent oxidoreductase, partial [Burkholderiales bacterium]
GSHRHLQWCLVAGFPVDHYLMGLPCLRPEAASVTSTTSIAEGQDIQRYHGAMHMGVQRRAKAVYDVGFTGFTGYPAYVASMHAVNGLTANAAIDYAPYGIRVNSVNIAATDTPMVAAPGNWSRRSIAQASEQHGTDQDAVSVGHNTRFTQPCPAGPARCCPGAAP